MPDAGTLQLIKTITGLGGGAILAFVVLAFLKGWIVTGREFLDCQKQRDEWKDIATRDVNNTDRLQDTADRFAEMVDKLVDLLSKIQGRKDK